MNNTQAGSRRRKYYYIESSCAECGKAYMARRDDVAKGRAKYCSKPCHAAGMVRYRRSISSNVSRKERRAVYALVARAISNGELTRAACESCGCGDTEAHHDDYSQALTVRWLCKRHHLLLHLGKQSNLKT